MTPSSWSRRGFTLVETLIALVLVSVLLLPASFWLVRSRAGRAAWEKFHAVQALEMRINRAVLTRLEKDMSEEMPEPWKQRIEIRVIRDGGDSRRVGTVRDRQGRQLATLDAWLFGVAQP